jgi:N-acetylglutamate synthase-like GNAT family acetyltransferase
VNASRRAGAQDVSEFFVVLKRKNDFVTRSGFDSSNPENEQASANETAKLGKSKGQGLHAAI